MNANTPPVPAPHPLRTPEQEARLNAIREKQGITGPTPIEYIQELAKGLWETDEEFDAFMEAIREARSNQSR